MADDFQVTSTTSWGQRIMGSFMGVLVGIIVFFGSFALLWWGEGRSIERARALEEGSSLVMPVAADTVAPQNEGKLVHLSGKASADTPIGDEDFGITGLSALKLERNVSMYQWKETSDTETKENLGGSETSKTTYTYDKEWSDRLIDSSEFKKREGHENPDSMPYDSESIIATGIRAGTFKLTEPFVDQISDFNEFPLNQEHYDAMDQTMQDELELYKGGYSSSQDPAKPEIGDVRITYTMIPISQLSVIGKQSRDAITTYRTKHGTIELLATGDVDADAMFAQAHSENEMITWLLRLLGFVLMAAGIGLMFRPIRILGAVVPFIGMVLGAGIGLVAFITALGLSILTIAVAWLFYRPLIGIPVLLLALGILFGGFRWLMQKVRRQPAAATV